MKKDYKDTYLDNAIILESLQTVHYFKFSPDYNYRGESHDFWEFIYIDFGILNVRIENDIYTLEKGDLILIGPNEFHNVWGNYQHPSDIAVISFRTPSMRISELTHKIIKTSQRQQFFIGQFLREARLTFATELEKPAILKLEKREYLPFGCEQSLKNYLELLIIDLIRKDMEIPASEQLIKNKYVSSGSEHTDFVHTDPVHYCSVHLSSVQSDSFQSDSFHFGSAQSSSIKLHKERSIIRQIQDYFENHLGDSTLTLQQVCKDNCVSSALLQQIFRNNLGTGVIEYYNNLRIERAMHLIQVGKYNMTEISEILGYNSLHYFSKCFKKAVGIPPTAYASSIEALHHTYE